MDADLAAVVTAFDEGQSFEHLVGVAVRDMVVVAAGHDQFVERDEVLLDEFLQGNHHDVDQLFGHGLAVLERDHVGGGVAVCVVGHYDQPPCGGADTSFEGSLVRDLVHFNNNIAFMSILGGGAELL